MRYAFTVREQFGLLTLHGAVSVIIATVGHFIHDACDFATAKRIQLVNGAALLSLVERMPSWIRMNGCTGFRAVLAPPIGVFPA